MLYDFDKGNILIMTSPIKKKAISKAKELGRNAKETDIVKIEEKLPFMKKGIIAKVWDKVLFLWEQIKSPEIPVRLKVVVIGALLYLILPFDVLPDTIPALGFTDDLWVILTVVKEVSKFVVPKLEKKLENKLYNLGYKKIDAKLSVLYTSILFTTIITFLINAIACTILITKPFGEETSRNVAIVIFSVIFIYSLVRFIIYIKNYGQLTKKIAVSVCKKKSLSLGISDFVCTEYRYIAYFFDGLEIVKSVVPELKDIPDGPQIVSTFKNHYKKRIILFFICLLLYTALITLTKLFLLA